MENFLVFALGIFATLIVTVLAGRANDLLKERRSIIIERKTSTVLAQIPDTAAGNLRLIYKGVRVQAFYDTVYTIFNQAFDPVNEVELSVIINPPRALLDYKLVDRSRNRTCKVDRVGNEIKITAPYLNSLRALNDKLELHIFSEQEIKNIGVGGSGSGWSIQHRGSSAKEESVVSPTSGAYVCIEGPIGVGKSTLAELLQRKWSSKILYEEFEKNPFLSDFYKDRGGYAFQTQIFFLLSRYSQLAEIEMEGFPLVADYMFAKDSIFARLNLFGDELKTYLRGYNVLNEHLPKPNLVIYLTADIDSLLTRISKRGREYERDMKTQYLSELARLYEDFFANYREAPVFKLDTTNLNIVDNSDDQTSVLKLIQDALGHNS